MGPPEEALAALQRIVGPDAEFRPGQLEAIRALVEERRRVLVVQRTGWGKSAVYFVATALLRAAGAGPTLLVSPLLGLMRNQIAAARRGGVRAETINSDNTEEWDPIIERLHAGEVDALLVSPERFANARFRDEVLPPVAAHVGLFVIDEAHCISDWGHDFRPDYRRLVRVLDLLPHGVPVLCTTATANDRVVADIIDQLGDDLVVRRGPLDRPSLALDVVDLPTQPQRLAWLATVLPELPGTGIVYTLTVDDAHRVATWLISRGIAAAEYSGPVDGEQKQRVEDDLLHNRLKAVVATSALGMGYDKPDLAFVIHFQAPGSPIAYYQQVGRAGRAVDHAHGVLLAGREDEEIQDWFIRTAFPPQEQAEAVIGLLDERADWTTLHEIEAQVNVRRSRLQAMLKILEVEGAVERDGTRYRRTLAPWSYPTERVAHVTAQRRAEQQEMRDYLAGETCLMERLRRALDDPEAKPCGRCVACLGGPLLPVELDPELVGEAVSSLRKETLALEPRKQWADLKRIPADRRMEEGRVLSIYGDGGWGTLVKEQRAAGCYDDALVDALAALARRFDPQPAPRWVTCVPSRRRPDLVPSLARRLAGRLGLPFHEAVEATRDARPQKELENSQQQFANVAGAFRVVAPPPEGPVLLVDDIVGSRWTLTVIAAALRDAGSGPVFPLVLARAMSD